MGRPCKSIETKTGAISKANEERRKENENALKGGNDKVSKASMPLTRRQKKIRRELVDELSNVLTNVDCYILDQCVIAIDRIQEIEKEINDSPDLKYDKSVIAAKKQYFAEFVRLCSELSMSPQSRAKIANNMTSKPAENPLLRLMSDDFD